MKYLIVAWVPPVCASRSKISSKRNWIRGRRKVNRDGHIEVARAYYSVPPEYLGRQVWVRFDSRMIRIYNDHLQQIAVHVRVLPGKFHTNRSHLADARISSIERGVEDMLTRARRPGHDAGRWAAQTTQATGGVTTSLVSN